MDCPEGGAELEDQPPGLFDDVPGHPCAACGGAFYPAGSLDRLDDSVTIDAGAILLSTAGPATDPRPPGVRSGRLPRPGPGHRPSAARGAARPATAAGPRPPTLGGPGCGQAGYRGRAVAALSRLRAEDDPELARCARCEGFWLPAGALDRLRGLVLRLCGEQNRTMNEAADARAEDRRKKRRKQER